MQSVISVENVSKQYRLGEVGTGTISHDLNRWWARIRGKDDPYLKVGEVNDRSQRGESDYVWALRDISFEVKQGDVLGIVGRNGAGKSTLLKILSKTTGPTEGQIKIKGRIASLLEVGTGFHPELTGRENVFLNGAILGMTKREIKAKFDEIVDFSGVERYIDTPVKRYSSGMYVRLAFAVAAHLEPEILIVDEVLAVGDVEFQKRCLGKMKDVSSKDGRTVLFVSHNMQSILSLTNEALFLHNGIIKSFGKTSAILSEYLKYGISVGDYIGSVEEEKKEAYIKSVNVKTSSEGKIQVHGQPLIFEIVVCLKRPLNNGAMSIQLFNSSEVPVVHFWLFNTEQPCFSRAGELKYECVIPSFKAFLGDYTATVYFSEYDGRELIERVEHVCPFRVEMFDSQRSHPWQEGSSTYLDNFKWHEKST